MPVQFLIKKTDRLNPKPKGEQTQEEKDKEARDWKRGDPILCFSDTHVFGFAEDKREWFKKFGNYDNYPDDFVILKILDMDEAEGKTYQEIDFRAATISDPEYNAPDVEDRVVLRAKRLWTIDLDNLPSVTLNLLNTNGYAEILRTDVKTQFFNKQTSETIP